MAHPRGESESNTGRSRRWRRGVVRAMGWLIALLVVSAVLSAWLDARARDRFPREPADRRALFVATAAGEMRALLATGLPRGTDPRPIVLLHGAFGGAEDWAATVLDRVGERGYALAFDRPGHGYSAGDARERAAPVEQARRIGLAIDALGLERPIIVGFSFGASVALALAMERGEQLAGMLLVGPVSHPWPGPADLGYRIAGAPYLGPFLARTVLPPIARVVAPFSVGRGFEPAPVEEQFERSPLALALSPPRLFANTEDMRLLNRELALQAPRYGAIRLPVVVLQGSGDVVVSPVIHARALARDIPGAELREIEDGGHQLPYSHPEAVLDALDRLIARIAENAAER